MPEKFATPLDPGTLRRRCDPDALGFDTTEVLEDLPQLPGQERAIEALRFGLGLRASDYHVFALGPTGLGKHAAVRDLLEEQAARERTPDDWCYVHDFQDRNTPRPLRLPPGRGAQLRAGMEGLVPEIRAGLRAALESEAFRGRSRQITEEVKRTHEEAMEEVAAEAARQGLVLLRTPDGFLVAPVRDGRPLPPSEVEALPPAERERISRALDSVHLRVEELVRKVPARAREARAQTRRLIEEVAREVLHQVLGELRQKFSDLESVLAYLDAVEQDLIAHADDLLGSATEEEGEQGGKLPELPLARRYRVNLLVDNSRTRGAPVIYEDHPTHPNLFGRVEHMQVLGALLTDFNLIKPGALQRANGGYLILDALKLLQQPFAWEGLKRALQAREVRLQGPVEALGLAASAAGLDPRPIPIDVKVVLLGERRIHHLLGQYDPEFRELFKVLADFAEELPWTGENERDFARLLGGVARRERTRPLDRGAVAKVVEEAARRAGDRERLSIEVQSLSDLVREADRWAALAGQDEAIRATHVERALAEREHRSDRVREESYERIARGTHMIDLAGSVVGQVNGLAVLQVGELVFGQPTRITARVRLGKGQVLDVEREVELGGPIHSKGVLILEGFLSSRYATDVPLSLAASLVFEQSYSPIEGDSASLAELCCLLSALAEAPLRQGVALTGSVNQHGRAQPIGGVNEKIEGFFDVCRKVGLTGEQGVIVPRANLPHLMLRADVVEAARAGQFRVWAVDDVDEALELLTGRPAGRRDREGAFPEGSINRAVEARLHALAETARAFAREASSR